MAVIIKTTEPGKLLKLIRTAIDNKDIDTWSYDGDGDFTHTPDQWKDKAWLRPKVYTGELRFGILGQRSASMTDLIYGIYHGRFIEMLLMHFDNHFTTAAATAKKTEPDVF